MPGAYGLAGNTQGCGGLRQANTGYIMMMAGARADINSTHMTQPSVV